MATIPNGFPISLRSWPSKSADATDLPTLFQRIQTERGGFVNISEDILREEIAKEEAGQVVEDESEDEEDKNAEDVKARTAARQDLLQQITTAHHSALNSLNFVSLLLSKANPAAVTQTISPELRDLIPLGTLGATKANAAWITTERKDDNRLVAKGWKSRDVNKSIDSILASATRLESEIQKETTYWEEILSIHDKGWSVSKVPRRKGVLGVRLGSSEATPVLKPQGLAILSRADSGCLKLVPNPVTNIPKILRIRIQVKDEITGTSLVPRAYPPSAPTYSHLLQTRNTLFALELWHELNREARVLGTFSIQSRGDTLQFPISQSKTAILDLHPLSDTQSTSSPSPDDHQTQALYLALNILLSYTHRQSLRRRSIPPKPKPNSKRQGTSNSGGNKQPNLAELPTLFRPLLVLLNHQTTLTQMHTMFDLIRLTLTKSKAAHIPTYSITSPAAVPPSFLSNAERSVALLTNHLTSITTYTILPSVELQVIPLTNQFPLPTTRFLLKCQPDNAQIWSICPPPPMRDRNGFVALTEVMEYVLFVTSAAVALQLSSIYQPPAGSTSAEDGTEETQTRSTMKEEGGEKGEWLRTPHPTTLKFSASKAKAQADGRLLTINLSTLLPVSSEGRQGLKISATYSFNNMNDLESVASGGKGLAGEIGDQGAAKEGEGSYEWVVVDGEDDKEGEEGKSLKEIVEEAGQD